MRVRKIIASSLDNKMQREEIILLKTSDGSIEVSCIHTHIKNIKISEQSIIII